MTILDLPILSRIRRNHGLEHATLNILSGRFPHLRLGGYSYSGGFFIFGQVPTSDLSAAVIEALMRLEGGERGLAVHARCGTNYAAMGLVAGLLAWLGMAGANTRRSRLERLPLVISLATLGVMFSQPLGPLLQQRVTTSGDPQGLRLVEIIPNRRGAITIHRVVTGG
jgi:hypothetical protein